MSLKLCIGKLSLKKVIDFLTFFLRADFVLKAAVGATDK